MFCDTASLGFSLASPFKMQPILICPYCKEALRFDFSDDETQLLRFLDCQSCGAKFDLNDFQSDDLTEPQQDSDNPQSDLMELELELDDSESIAPWAAFTQAASRPKRKEASILRKVIPPVLGGLAAFPIATAIMWYGLGKDLGSTGPFVAKYLPAIVPRHLQSGRSASPEPIRRKPVSPPTVASNLPKLSAGTATPSEEKPKESSVEANQQEKTSVASLSEQIALMRSMQEDLYSAPKAEKGAMIARYYENAKVLARQTESLRGPAATVWRKELESLAREILKDKNCKMVMQLGPAGKIPGVKAAIEGDYVVTVLHVSASDVPEPNGVWQLTQPWTQGNAKISVQMRPGAWRNGAAVPPTNCLVFGKLISSEPSEPEAPLQLLAFAALTP